MKVIILPHDDPDEYLLSGGDLDSLWDSAKHPYEIRIPKFLILNSLLKPF